MANKDVKAADGKGEKDIDALLERMSKLEDTNRQLQEERIALLGQRPQQSGGQQQQTPQLPDEPTLDTTGMPDMLTKPDEYNAELERRLKTYNSEMRQYEQKVREANEAAAQSHEPQVDSSALWAAYKEDHPEYAKKESWVRFAAGEAVAQLQKRGVDAQALMQRSPEDFFKKVNEVYDKEFGAPESGDEGDGGDEGDADDRTAGMFGGQEAGGRPTPGKKGGDDGPTFTQQLKEVQDSMWAKPGNA